MNNEAKQWMATLVALIITTGLLLSLPSDIIWDQTYTGTGPVDIRIGFTEFLSGKQYWIRAEGDPTMNLSYYCSPYTGRGIIIEYMNGTGIVFSTFTHSLGCYMDMMVRNTTAVSGNWTVRVWVEYLGAA